ncbi:hypothetical protein MC885_006579, partial [Smutsia gigantea]
NLFTENNPAFPILVFVFCCQAAQEGVFSSFHLQPLPWSPSQGTALLQNTDVTDAGVPTLFQLYAETDRGVHDSGAHMNRRALRNLLTDLQHIPTVVGESRALYAVESATRSCFQGVLSPAIKEEKFLSWLQAEPPTLLWLPTCYRLSATKMVTHPVRCRICRNFPITGLKYHCLKCLNFDICQMCFLSGLHSKSHQQSHPVTEHCVQVTAGAMHQTTHELNPCKLQQFKTFPLVSAKENTKLLLRTLRNNLLQGRCRKREALRR